MSRVDFLVCRRESTQPLGLEQMCAASVEPFESAIDDYFARGDFLVQQSIEPTFGSSPELLRLLLLGLLSATESYFRSILASLLELCPFSREHSKPQVFTLGAADYYKGRQLGLAILEQKPLSGAAEVRKHTEKLTGFNIRQGSSVEAALRDFDKLCHLRHAAVHSYGEFGGHNLRVLELEPESRSCLNLDRFKFQRLIGASHNVVRAYNGFLFENVVGRWIDKCFLNGTWQEDREQFRSLFMAFRSKHDGVAPTNAYQAHRKLNWSGRS